MKKLLTVLCGILVALSLFVTTGNTAKAAVTVQSDELSGECGCVVEPILGSERNKIAANLISSEAFKTVKKNLKKDGLKWTDANSLEVIHNISHNIVMVGVPFENKHGDVFMAVFFDGTFMGVSPADEH
ncbi:hypothetical protein FAY30_13205 [Bacillus sp. S3]|uniref:hypothetical protein n=1 Tax=Bacillus sp. S3 TaxID=486398 RepID=UPI00118C0B47|nr:hypothetical protein [Bacillus sp. S3]QCJ42790.1 hypothetical protein FAY30_13205 [Bacillus sp. S3]